VRKSLLLLIAAVLALGFNCQAAVIVYAIQDIGSFEDYASTDLNQTFPGTGSVGMNPDFGFGPSYAHMLGLEDVDYSRTILEVDISALAGLTINSAILSFQLLNGSESSHGIQATSYTATGNLAYAWDPPDNLGTISGTVNSGANTLDVTSLLAARAGASAGWLGLHLQGSDHQYLWTYTWTGFFYNSDSAQMRLTVDYTEGTIPEPGTCGLVAGALLAFGHLIRRQRARP
jgi:hypothetical protein